MLKEMTLLVIVLWGSQGRPTARPQEQDLRVLSELYCKAEALLRKYKSVDEKFLPPEARPGLASTFSQPGCNFTELTEECQILRSYHALFLWLEDTYPQEELLTPVRDSITSLTALQEGHTCLKGASHNSSQITCPKYSNNQPKLENEFHYIFELFRNHTHNLLLSKLPKEQRNVTDICGSNN